MPELNEYEYLDTAPEYLTPIVNLIRWTSNETWPKKPEHPATTYALFLDITGLSDELGLGPLTAGHPIARGHIEMSYLSDALDLYSYRPYDVSDFITEYERLAMESA